MRLITLIFLLLMTFLPVQHVNAELLIEHDGKTIKSLNKEQISLLHHENYFFQPDTINKIITELQEVVYEPPKNAYMNDEGVIKDGVAGVLLDQVKLRHLLMNYLYANETDVIQIPTRKQHPRVTSELLSEISQKKIGSYETFYNASNIDRTHNVVLSTRAINNYVVFPNEKFSFNKVVGERTRKRGYRRAPVIVRGEFAEDIGGGICQVSSTLYNAVNIDGIDVMERYSHSREVPYVPPGKDATVSWNGPDFVFKNVYKYPVLIRASSENGKTSISIYTSSQHSTDDGENT